MPQVIPPSVGRLISLPFDVFLELVKRMDVWEVVQLRHTCRTLYELTAAHSVWIILAETITRRRPIPLPPFRIPPSLSPAELQKAVCHAARLERNWTGPVGRLRAPHRMVHEPERENVDILVLLHGGKRLVTGARSGHRGGIGGVLCAWDLDTGDRLATFEIRFEDDVLQWRSVDEGRAVMFLIRDGILSAGPAQHLHLLRLEFLEGPDSISASFFHHSSLIQELPVVDTSLSEDVVLVLAVDSDTTVIMFILQWRDGTMVSVKTDLTPPDHPYFAILSLHELSIWVDSPLAPRIYSFTISSIYPHLAYPAKPPIFLPQPTPTILNHTSNISPEPPPGFTPLYRDTTRKWGAGSLWPCPLLSRSLSILYVASCLDNVTQQTMTCLSHEYLPTRFSSYPTDRTYFAPLSIVTSHFGRNEDGEVLDVPIIAADAANIVFPEMLPSGGVQMRVMTLPPDDPAERHRPPEWYNEHLMRPLEAPPELDLDAVVMMSLDDAAGVLAVAVNGGDIFILEY